MNRISRRQMFYANKKHGDLNRNSQHKMKSHTGMKIYKEVMEFGAEQYNKLLGIKI